MSDVFVYDAVRTVRGKGKPDGSLAGVPPHALIAQTVAALRQRNGDSFVDEAARLHLGCVSQVGAQGGHLALVSRMAAGLPDAMAVTTLNNYCASSLSAIGQAAAMVRGDGGVALAGGVESMSQVPFLADNAAYYNDPILSAELGYFPVALAADVMATREGVSRATLDAVTLESHKRAGRAWARGDFDDVVIAVNDAAGDVALAGDELVRETLSAEALERLPPAFVELGQRYDPIIVERVAGLERVEHRHSVANCPPMCDGAAMAVLGRRLPGRRPKAMIRAFAEVSADRSLQLTAGTVAMNLVLARASMTLADVALIELMEAFAVVPSLFLRDHDVDPARVNPSGGHLAMGHPMGATGAILVSHAVAGMQRLDVESALVVVHGGGGVGAAMILERAS